MRNRFSWIVWSAVVVAGTVASFQIWLRAFDGGSGLTAGAPTSVAPSLNRKVPAIIGRGTRPSAHGAQNAPGAQAAANERRSRLTPAVGAGLQVAPGSSVVTGAVPSVRRVTPAAGKNAPASPASPAGPGTKGTPTPAPAPAPTPTPTAPAAPVVTP